MSDSTNSEFAREQSQAREEFKKVTEIRRKLDLLARHVASRKDALEEEIQEHLHESLANARESMERIEENIAPKVEKAIRTKMEEVDRKMARMNEDGLVAVREELVKATPDITKEIIKALDKLVAENTRFAKMEILNEIREELDAAVKSATAPIDDKLEKGLSAAKVLSFAALVLSAAALLGMVWVAVK